MILKYFKYPADYWPVKHLIRRMSAEFVREGMHNTYPMNPEDIEDIAYVMLMGIFHNWKKP